MTTFSRHSAGDQTGPADPFSGLSGAERATVGSVLDALSQPRLANELRGQEEAVAAITARICPRRTRPRLRLTRPSITVPALLRGRTLAALGAAACVLAGTSGAAIAGMLPGPVQSVAHRVLNDVGVTVPQAGGTPPASGGAGTQDGQGHSGGGTAGGGGHGSHAAGTTRGGHGSPAGDTGAPGGGQGRQHPQGGQGAGRGQGGGSTATHGQGAIHRHVPTHPPHGGGNGGSGGAAKGHDAAGPQPTP
jgi:hypothetical protein